MLKHSLQQVTGHADIEGVASAGHDVREINPLIHGENVSNPVDDGNSLALRRYLLGEVWIAASLQSCHPERGAAQSKDLRLLFGLLRNACSGF
jgi:hypothetical protein